MYFYLASSPHSQPLYLASLYVGDIYPHARSGELNKIRCIVAFGIASPRSRHYSICRIDRYDTEHSHGIKRSLSPSFDTANRAAARVLQH
jgi:hypothetical protein